MSKLFSFWGKDIILWFYFVSKLLRLIMFYLLLYFYLNFKSGLLTIYVTLEYTNGKYSNFNSFGFLISRFIRFIPQLIIFMLLSTLIPLLSSGPVWKQHISSEVNNCYTNWWQNIIFLQNFINPQNMVYNSVFKYILLKLINLIFEND